MPYFWILLIACLLNSSIPLIATDSLQELKNYLYNVATEHRNHPSSAVPIIAIGGCPGVGKSYLAKMLVMDLEEKGFHAVVLPLDHFNLSPQERKKIGTEWDIRHFKPDELTTVLQAIANGQKNMQKPTCNQLTGEIGSEQLDLQEVDLVLFDGLYALCSCPPLNFFPFCQSGIFLEAETASIYAWKWEREQKKSTPRTPEQFLKHMAALMADYEENIAYSKENAQFLINKDSDHQYQLQQREFMYR